MNMPTNIGGASLGGDRPGSRNEYTENRHKELYNLFKPSVQSNIKILDIGCAMGIMLSFFYMMKVFVIYMGLI